MSNNYIEEMIKVIDLYLIISLKLFNFLLIGLFAFN